VLIAELTSAEEDPGAVKNSHVTGKSQRFLISLPIKRASDVICV